MSDFLKLPSQNNYFEKLPRLIIMKIANFLKIKDRANVARTCKKLSIVSPGIDKMRLVYDKLLKNTKRLQIIVDGYFCRNCHDCSPYDLIECTICGRGVCENCIYYNTALNLETSELRDDKMCAFCEHHVFCSICDEPAIAKCFTCTKKICSAHSIKNSIWRGDAYECHECYD